MSRYKNYEQMSAHSGMSVRKLQRAVEDGRITRYRAAGDRRVTLLDVEEVEAVFGTDPFTTPAA